MYPRRKKIDFDLVKDEPEFTAIDNRWKAKADEVVATQTAAEKEFEAKLKAEAMEDIPATSVLGQVMTTSASNYRTVGFGASHYAEKAAEGFADIARFYGFHADRQYGWELESTYDDRKEAREDLRRYRAESPFPCRLVRAYGDQ